MFGLIDAPLNLLSLLILVLVVVLIFNPWGLRDKLLEYVNLQIDIDIEKISGDFLDWLKSQTLDRSAEGVKIPSGE